MAIREGDRPPGGRYERFSFLRRRNQSERVESTVTYSQKTLLGTTAPAAWASPGCDDAVLPVRRDAPHAGNTRGNRIRPRPLWGQGWSKEGCRIREILHVRKLSSPYLNYKLCVSQIFRQNRFWSGKIRAVQTFVMNFFGFFNVRTGKNPAGKTST
jgi:hypothetical protein